MKPIILSSLSLLFLLLSNSAKTTELTLVTTLYDNKGKLDGLDNVRKMIAYDNGLYSVSADDNSFTSFKLADNFSAQLTQVIKSKEQSLPLEGAVGITASADHKQMFIVSFYSGSIVHLVRNTNDIFEVKKIFSDFLDPHIVFDESKSIELKDDKLSLLGPYDVLFNDNLKMLVVASYMSNSIVVYRLTNETKLQPYQIFKGVSFPNLSRPTAITMLENKIAVIATGSNCVLLFETRAETSAPINTWCTDKNKFINDASEILFDSKRKTLLIANKHNLLEVSSPFSAQPVITELKDENDKSIPFISSLTLSSTGNNLIALSEQSNKVYILKRVIDSWKSHYELTPKLADGDQAKSPTDAVFLKNESHLAISFGESDAINIYRLNPHKKTIKYD